MSAKSYARILGANDRIGIGFVGAGGMGTSHLNACKDLKDSDNLQFFGVADCWKTRAEQGAAILKTDAVTDYHTLLGRKEIDYVTIATPEHRHAQIVLELWMPEKPSTLKSHSRTRSKKRKRWSRNKKRLVARSKLVSSQRQTPATALQPRRSPKGSLEKSSRLKSNMYADTTKQGHGEIPPSIPRCLNLTTWTGPPGGNGSSRCLGIRTIISSGVATEHIPEVLARICSSTASRGLSRPAI